MKKRILSVTSVSLALALLYSTFTGCSGGASSSSAGSAPAQSAAAQTEKATISWWTPNWDEATSKQFVSEFEAKNPNIKVNLVITDWDTYKSKITTAASTDNAPDLATVLVTDVPQFAKQALAENLDSAIKDNNIDKDDFLKNALDIATVNNSVYGLPFRYDGSGMYYNVDLLKSAGYTSFPTTWDDFVTMCKKLTKNGVYGFAWPLGDQANAATRLVQQFYTYGGDSVLNSDESKCMLNSDAGKKALSNIVNSMKEKYASPNSLEWDNTKMRVAFGSGKLAVLFSGPFDVDTIKKDYPKLNFKTAVIPGISGMGCTTANGWAVMECKNSKNKEAAGKFLSYIILPENQARLTQSFPASKTAMKMAKFNTDTLAPFLKQLDNSKAEPGYQNWAEIEPILYSYIQKAVSGSISVDDACAGMEKDVNAVLG
jgi:ABC-type glycerol-3-phosphate transport system substrate-binding protein